MKTLFKSLFIFSLFAVSCTSQPKEEVVNIYTHRHYDADKFLFEKFEKETGIKVNIVSASADELIAKLEQEGKMSQADLLFSVDAGRIARAKAKGVLQPVQSEKLNKQVAAKYRDPENYWFGISMRARIIAVSNTYETPADLTYQDLAKPEWKGKVLMRSSDNIYNQSLLASIVAHAGEDSAAKWTEGVVANFARDPKGNDRDQVRAIAAGEGAITVVNSYYIGKMKESDQANDVEALEKVTLVYPNDGANNTHVNISAAALVKHAPNKENAIQFMEFLTTAESQAMFFEKNQEYPVSKEIPSQQSFDAVGTLQPDPLPLSALGKNQSKAVSLFENAGWK